MQELIQKFYEWLTSDDAVWFFFGWEANMFVVEPNWGSAIFCLCIIALILWKPDPL